MRKTLYSLGLVTASMLMAQDSLKTVQLEEVAVLATRANEKTPMAYSTVKKEAIRERNLGQDLPILLNFSPSIVTTSDAGAGIGYTGMRIRGSDASRVNVTINGVPLNDPESHGVFWVNMPDFSSSLNSIQIQRGVGSSSNGAGAFGGTVNLQTSLVSPESFVETSQTIGSFNTWKSNVTVNSGLINDLYNFEARLSKITSDGYVDRSEADLKSYYLTGGRYGKKTMIKAVIFGGQEITNQAWYGTPEAVLNGNQEDLQAVVDFGGEYSTQEQIDNLMSADRKFNYYLYDNEIDDYRQDHYQLHVGHSFSDAWNLSTAFHYTRGRGFFEQYQYDDDLEDYGISDLVIGTETITSSDMVRRRWLDNHFYGTTFGLNYTGTSTDVTFGGAWNTYVGDHFGEIIWAEYAIGTNIRDRYYEGDATKTDFNSFIKANFQVSDQVNVFSDLQVRTINYKTAGLNNNRLPYDVDQAFTFFNPKIGLTWGISNGTEVYASYAIGNREPVRDDLINNPDAKAERMGDLEMGIKSQSSSFSYRVNYYLMSYTDQLVLTGAVNDVGEAIRINVPKSYRTGIELESAWAISDKFIWSGNLTLSQNRIEEFTEIVFDYGAAFDEFNVVEIQHEDTDISFSPNVVVGNSLAYSKGGFTTELLTKYVGKQYLDNTSNDNRAIDPYLTNDLRFSYQTRLGEIKYLELSLLINNILDEEYSSNGYTWGYYYGQDLYQQNNYYPQAGTNFLAGVTVRF